MPEWDAVHRAFAVESFFKCGESYVTTMRAFHKRFSIMPGKPVPSRNTLRLWIQNFREKGTVNKTKPPGPQKSVRTPENIERVRDAFQKSPRRSHRKHAASLNLKANTVLRILHEDLSYHPYKLLMTQQLLTTDPAARLKFCRRMLREIKNEELSLNNILFTDEAHFYLHGDVNNQNMRYWSDENPRVIEEQPLHSPKVTVWMGVASFGVIGPYFFDGSFNGERYRNMLNEFFLPQLRRKRRITSTWFQQDGATCHTATETMNWLRKHFRSQIISRGSDFSWPPRSPDLSCCDFFLWGYLKSKVYADKPRDLAHLRANIERETRRITPAICKKVITNFKKRLEICVKNKGHHLKDVILKTK